MFVFKSHLATRGFVIVYSAGVVNHDRLLVVEYKQAFEKLEESTWVCYDEGSGSLPTVKKKQFLSMLCLCRVPDGLFSNLNLGKSEDLGMENVAMFYEHSEYLKASLYYLWPFGIVCGHLVYFFPF
jgi:hypothetical protein